MPQLFKKHLEGILVAFAVVFSVIMFGYFIFGIASATHGIADVFGVNRGGTSNAGFNMSAAAKLNIRGLVQ